MDIIAIHYTVWGENVGRNGIVAIVGFLIFLIKNWKMKSCKQEGWGLMDLVWCGFSSFLPKAISALKLGVKRTCFCPANKTGIIFSSVGRATLRSHWPHGQTLAACVLQRSEVPLTPWPDILSLCFVEGSLLPSSPTFKNHAYIFLDVVCFVPGSKALAWPRDRADWGWRGNPEKTDR